MYNARVLTFDADNRVLEDGAVEVLGDGTIGRVGASRQLLRIPGATHINAGGKLLMPALINCHTHLYSTLARGMVLPGPPPRNFPEILQRLWWRLDRALSEDDVYYSALVGLLDAARCGVGTVVDHHSSPNACAGSLDVIERAFRKVGLRGALCYEVSDRNGLKAAQQGIRENIRFIEKTQRANGRATVQASFGLHASFTLSDRTLARCREANTSLAAGFHIHVAEDRCDRVGGARGSRGSPVVRLVDAGILDARALAAHCIHVSAADMRLLAEQRVNVVHNPESNCNNAVGAARVLEMCRRGVLVGLGSDGYSPRLWDEFKAALQVLKLQARDPAAGHAEVFAAAFLNNRTIARKAWGMDLGRIAPGAAADLLLLDYDPPTPLTRDNLLGHILFGIANAPVDALLVQGRFVVRDKECVTVDPHAIAEKARARAHALWRRLP